VIERPNRESEPSDGGEEREPPKQDETTTPGLVDSSSPSEGALQELKNEGAIRKIGLEGVRVSFSSGPIPPPPVMNEYSDRTQEVVLTLALNEQSKGDRFQSHIERLQTRGQVFEFIVAMSCLAVATFLIFDDKAALGSIAGLVAILYFIRGLLKQATSTLGFGHKNRRRKDGH